MPYYRKNLYSLEGEFQVRISNLYSLEGEFQVCEVRSDETWGSSSVSTGERAATLHAGGSESHPLLYTCLQVCRVISIGCHASNKHSNVTFFPVSEFHIGLKLWQH